MSFSYTLSGSVFVPENQITEHRDTYSYVRLRGYAHTVAVYEKDTCIGWAVKTSHMKVEDR